jgi:hypothetical protein
MTRCKSRKQAQRRAKFNDTQLDSRHRFSICGRNNKFMSAVHTLVDASLLRWCHNGATTGERERERGLTRINFGRLFFLSFVNELSPAMI